MFTEEFGTEAEAETSFPFFLGSGKTTNAPTETQTRDELLEEKNEIDVNNRERNVYRTTKRFLFPT